MWIFMVNLDLEFTTILVNIGHSVIILVAKLKLTLGGPFSMF
jgi:hypothetical protein